MRRFGTRLLVVLPLALLCSFQGTPSRSHWVCEADRSYEGEQQNDHYGKNLAVGNWNGTGGPDLLICGGGKIDVIDGQAVSLAIHNRVCLYLDGAVGSTLTNANCATGPAGLNKVLLEGEEAGDRFGWAAIFLPDVEGDGKDELVISTPRSVRKPTYTFPAEPFTDRGRVYLFFSSKQQLAFGNGACLSAASANLILEGAADGTRFGWSLASAGDFDGDGKGDLAVGAPGNWENATTSGQVFLYKGAKLEQLVYGNPFVLSHPASSTAYAIFSGLAAGDRFGFSIALAGNSAGTTGGGDLVIGAPQFLVKPPTPLVGPWTFTGNGYVALLSKANLQLAGSYVTYTGAQEPAAASEMFGWSVSGGVDLNNDGRDDLLVGAPGRFDPITQLKVGRAYAISTNPADPLAYPAFLHRIDGTTGNPDANFGQSVLGIGDLDGDGTDEFAVGAPYDSQQRASGCTPSQLVGGGQCGHVYVYSGTPPAAMTPPSSASSMLVGLGAKIPTIGSALGSPGATLVGIPCSWT